jgi:hypothetical protein
MSMSATATRVVSALSAGTAFSRFLMVKAAARGDVMQELQLAERFKDSPTVYATVDLMTKSAIAPALTTDATWAAPLAAYGVAGEALQLLRGASIIGALESKMRRVPFRTKVARETAAARVARGSVKGSPRRRRQPRTTPSRKKPTRPPRSSCCRTNY